MGGSGGNDNAAQEHVATFVVAVVAMIGIVKIFPSVIVTLPNDGADAKHYTINGLQRATLREMFLIGGNAIRISSANVYNTTGFNVGADKRDICPAAIWPRSMSIR